MIARNALDVPSWAWRLIDPGSGHWGQDAEGLSVRALHGENFALVSVRVPAATSLDENSFRRATTRAYQSIEEELHGHSTSEPVRLWNLVPRILEPLGQSAHRYMAFNAGRYDAFVEKHGTSQALAGRVPASSGVGHEGEELVIHCLAAPAAGQAVENPRQTPAFQYSERYGPQPPCFARATRLEQGNASWLLVAGTASVLGEDCAHLENLEGQVDETMDNLEALLVADNPDHEIGRQPPPENVRVYVVRPEDEPWLRNTLPERLHTNAIEYRQAELCRPELLVEIEAVYRYPSRNQTAAA